MTNAKPTQQNNPLHGIKLEQIVTDLADYYGWDGLAERIPVNCFSNDPSVQSSLKFLRRTPWARDKVEALYLTMLSKKKPIKAAE
ncbi:VF530 family protein [Methylotenera sp.]|uniref:VF530 family protein n=1 Tax=Methylotenera sp. TaxID=2051956 RepID=UPI002487C2C2|nr:VF530 family protein [Methylotenera sp.]MDI1362481.1 VF530 family protein [Methylotenera sp.]